MTMPEYLKEIEHAVSGTISLAWAEHQKLNELEAHLAKFEAEIADSERRIQWLRDNPEMDDDLQSTAMHWESYFGPEKDLYYGEKSKEELEALLELRKFSTSALNSNVLQCAKQGISLVHEGFRDCPDGRMVGSQTLKTVIWQARNQAMHWDEGKPFPPVIKCFDALKADLDPKFSEYTSRNMATDVVALLGWNSFADFEKDMLLLS